MDPEQFKTAVTDAADIILTVIVLVAGEDKQDAIRGVEAMHQDMLRNIERIYNEEV